MIRSKNRTSPVYIKKGVTISSIILIFFLSIKPEGIWARKNDNSRVKTDLYDTLAGISGKIVDSISNDPIPFATITFYNDDETTISIVSDEKGEFTTVTKLNGAKVHLSAIGYKEDIRYLTSVHNNFFRLVPLNNILPNVIVLNKVKKKANADWIIKKVNKRLSQNYGELSFDQKFKVNSVVHNYDTTKKEITDQLDLHFAKDIKSIRIKKWDRDTAKYDAAFFNFIGVPELLTGDIILNSDILRRGLMIKEKEIKYFDIKLLAHYQDEKNGAVYLVSFRALGNYTGFSGGRTIGNSEFGFLKGQMLIREDDFAVVNLKCIFELKVERSNSSLELSYHTPAWKADRLSKIISNSVIYKHEYSYIKDTVSGKYFVQTIRSNCYQTGYQIENHRNVQLNYRFDATSLGIEAIVE